MELGDLPCDTSLLLTVNYVNLEKTIKFLYNNLKKQNEKVNDCYIQMKTFNDLRKNLEDFKIKFEASMRTMGDMQNTLNSFVENFMNMNRQFDESNKKITKLEKEIENLKKDKKESTKIINNHEENINNLNRVVEHNIKSFEKEKENITKNKNDIKDLKTNVTKLSKTNDNINNKITENNNQIMNIINTSNKTNNDNITNLNEKLKSINQNVDTLFGSVKEINSKLDMPPPTQIETVIDDPKLTDNNIELAQNNNNENGNDNNDNNDNNQNGGDNNNEINTNQNGDNNNDINTNTQNNNNINITFNKGDPNSMNNTSFNNTTQNTTFMKIPETLGKEDIKVLYNKLNSMDKTTEFNKVQLTHNINELNQKITLLQKSIMSGKTGVDPFEGLNLNPITTNISTINDNDLLSLKNDLNLTGADGAKGQKISQESLKMLGSALDNKANQKDLDNATKRLEEKLNLMNERISNTFTIFDNKIKTISSLTSGDGNGVDFDGIMGNLNENINNALDAKGKDLIKKYIKKIDLTGNVTMNEINEILTKHKDELDKAFESIVDIRKNLINKKFEEDVTSLLQRMKDNEETMRKLQFDLNEVSKTLEGEDGEDNGGPKISLRENINLLNQKIELINDNHNKLKNKVDSIQREILNIVKKDLQKESNRILEEFKGDLKMSINKIEDQLREKVDKFGLAEFGNRMGNAFNSQIKQKIDKNDMHRNNHLINRKIDNLENKISRTLVDTLIDLQMDEAPLMVKKNMKNVELCASCNQPLPQNNPYYVNRSVDFNNNMFSQGNNSTTNNNSRFKNTGKYVVESKDRMSTEPKK